MQTYYVGGECLLALLAFLVPGWRRLTLLCSALTASFLLTWPFVPDSPRWLASQVQFRAPWEIQLY